MGGISTESRISGERPRFPLAAAAAGAVALLAALLVASRELGSLGGDNAEYCLLARSIREGLGYRSAWAPGEAPLHTLYPPVFPLLLVPFIGSAPVNFLAAHLPVAAAAGAAVFLLALLFERRGLPPWAAAAAALVPALSLYWLRCAADLLSELPFLAFVAGALLALEPGGDGTERLPPRRIAAAATCAVLAYLTRTAGLALAIPVAAALVLDRRCRGRAGWIGACAVAASVLGWTFYTSAAGGGGGYLDQLGGGADGSVSILPERAFRDLAENYIPRTRNYLAAPVLPVWITWSGTLAWGLAAAVVVVGLLRRRTLAAAEAFFVLYLAMQCAWPFQDSRFALPLAALLAPFAVEMAHLLLVRFSPAPTRSLAATAFAVVLILPNAWIFTALILPRLHRPRPAAIPGSHEPASFTETWPWTDDQYRQAAHAQVAFLHACDLVREGGIPGLPEGPVMAGNPRVAALFTGRRAVQPPKGGTPDAVAARAREAGVVAVVVPDFGDPYAEALRGWRDARRGDLDLLLALPGGVEVFRVRR